MMLLRKKSDFVVENMDKSMYADTKWVKENLDKIKNIRC